MSISSTGDLGKAGNLNLLFEGLQPPPGTGKPGSVQGTQSTGEATGAGTAAGVQQVPDAAQQISAGSASMMGSVLSLMSELGGTGADQSVAFQEAAVKLKDKLTASEQHKITGDTKAQQAAMTAKEARQEEAQKKVDEASKKAKEHSVWDKIKLAFEYVGAILTIAAGAVLCATLPVAGQVAGALLIGAGVLMLVSAIDDTVAATNKDGMGMFAQAAYSDATRRGMSPDDAKKYAGNVAMGVSIAIMVVSVLLSLPSMALGVGEADVAMIVAEDAGRGAEIGSEAGEAAEATSDAVDLSSTATKGAEADKAEEATSDVQKSKNIFAKAWEALREGGGKPKSEEAATTAKQFNVAHKAIDGAQSAGNVAVTTGAGVTQYQATTLSADAKDKQAQAKQWEGLEKLMESMIDLAMTQLQQASTRANDVVGRVVDAQKDLGDTLSHAKF